ncbi:helix-turn-helix domain-containing protein [Konateibacter massiliensis]|uniref:helix-turn-helix domain-containing protein n=1 Tax=Konateibacter massiliensis TaxID=2002841 RepID=UPI000C15861D|nr:helix-turn-helix transcriptional regulator [Konateibacter massiliensis]
MNIADRIQNLRKSKGISQEELADKVGVSRQAVSKWESEQSLPDLEKIIIMSEYFGVTTDYILKGIEPAVKNESQSNDLASKILYLSSTALIAIGLFCGFGSWYEEQMASDIWGAMIIQTVGAAGYFIGRLLSPAKAPFTVKYVNILLVVFMPVSMLASFCLNRMIAPYPTDIISGGGFVLVYGIVAIVTFVLLRRRKLHG